MSPRQRHIAIRIGTCLEAVGVTDSLKLKGKSTGAKPSLVEKHTTPAHSKPSRGRQGVQGVLNRFGEGCLSPVCLAGHALWFAQCPKVFPKLRILHKLWGGPPGPRGRGRRIRCERK
jgi:hypothetical protein